LARFEEFQRLFMMSEPEALSLNAQAALGAVREPQRSQFSLLVRHFLERFFNHETASPDGDAKSRLILIASPPASRIHGRLVSLAGYHHSLDGRPAIPGCRSPPYWLQVNHHFFFVVYSFVAMASSRSSSGTFLSRPARCLRAHHLAHSRPKALPGACRRHCDLHRRLPARRQHARAPGDPRFLRSPNLPRLLIGHILAVLGSGLFSAAFILALQGVLLSLLGKVSSAGSRSFCKDSPSPPC